jgi:ketosteroid isomerase-like protein
VSQENVEVVEHAMTEFLAGIRTDFAADVEWHLDHSHPDQRVLRGAADVAEYFRGWGLAFEGMRIAVEEYLDRGDYVVTPFVVHGRPRGSNAEVELAETWTFKVQRGVIVEVREYLTMEAALAALDAEE